MVLFGFKTRFMHLKMFESSYNKNLKMKKHIFNFITKYEINAIIFQDGSILNTHSPYEVICRWIKQSKINHNYRMSNCSYSIDGVPPMKLPLCGNYH